MPYKIKLDKQDYLMVQQMYRGWAFIGIAIFGALLSTLVLIARVRHEAGVVCVPGFEVGSATTEPAVGPAFRWAALRLLWAPGDARAYFRSPAEA